MWVLTPWMWRKKLLNMTAAREWSDVGLPPLRNDAANDLPRPFRFSLKTWMPVWFVSLMVQNLFALCVQFEFRSDRHLHGSVNCEGAVQVLAYLEPREIAGRGSSDDLSAFIVF